MAKGRKKDWRERIVRYRVRQSIRQVGECEICSSEIEPGDLYLDGGYRRRSHKTCADLYCNTVVTIGVRIRIKELWDCPGRLGYCVGANIVILGTIWTPVIWDGEEDPDWHKWQGLEVNPDSRYLLPLQDLNRIPQG